MAGKRLKETDIRKVLSTINKSKFRPLDSGGNPGGLVELPGKLRTIVVGDLHACKENLVGILENEGNEREILAGKALLLLVGDTVHNDQTGQFREMASSLEILEYVLELFLEFGERIIYLRGNHDSFDELLVKSGIRQGLEFRQYVEAERGETYVGLVERFFQALPVFAIGNGFVVTHAGPVRGGTYREQLVEIYSDPDKYHQLMWNRINEFRGNPNSKEYAEYDIRRTLQKLELPENTHFVVGHNPLWNTGNDTGVWMDVLGVRNHHILYSGSNTRAPYMVFEKGGLVLKYAKAPEQEALYV
jgi:hypothetical protein